MRRLAPRILPALAATAALALLLQGCDRNAQNPYLIPTGIRPKPLIGTASLTGRVVYDPINAADITTPPSPATIVELWQNGARVGADTLPSDSRTFTFEHLEPGSYTVVATAHFFRDGSIPPVAVKTRPVEAGDVLMKIDPLACSVDIHLVGDFNGFPEDFPDSSRMDQNTLGIWSYPNIDYPAQVLTAGVHRVRFVTAYAVDNPTDYGGDQSQVLDVPVVQAPVRPVSGAGTDLSFRVATTGRYAITLDERRMTFSIQPVIALPPAGARRIVR